MGSPNGILILHALKAEAIGDLLADPLWDNALLAQVSPCIFELVLRYLLAGDINKAGFREHILSIQPPQLRQNAMTLAQQFIEEGRQEGRQEGMQKGMLIGQIRAIQEVLGVPLTPENTLFGTSLSDLEEMLAELKPQCSRAASMPSSVFPNLVPAASTINPQPIP